MAIVRTSAFVSGDPCAFGLMPPFERAIATASVGLLLGIIVLAVPIFTGRGDNLGVRVCHGQGRIFCADRSTDR